MNWITEHLKENVFSLHYLHVIGMVLPQLGSGHPSVITKQML